MLINLNREAIANYKKNVGIKEVYKGDLSLFTWTDKLSYLEDVEEDEEDLAEYDRGEEVNSDIELSSESEEEQED